MRSLAECGLKAMSSQTAAQECFVALEHFHFRCLPGTKAGRGFLPGKAALLQSRQYRLVQNQSHYVQRQSCRSAFFFKKNATSRIFSGYTYSDFALEVNML